MHQHAAQLQALQSKKRELTGINDVSEDQPQAAIAGSRERPHLPEGLMNTSKYHAKLP
jgi:hypothetical protein